MNRRYFLTASLMPLGMPLVLGAAKPWRMDVLSGGFDGTHYLAGLRIALDPNWKTYWRVPGAGGVPPSVAVTGENLVSFDVLYPIPHRFEDEGGQSLGYKDEVVFPILLKLADPTLPATLTFNVFLGVCETICIPASYSQDIVVRSGAMEADSVRIVQRWIDKVPVANDRPLIEGLRAEETHGHVILRAAVTKPTEDIFVEFASGKPYFAQRPEFSNGMAAMRVLGPKSAAEVQGQRVRLSYVDSGIALEQMVTIA